MILFAFWRKVFEPEPHLCVDAGRWVFEVCKDHIGFTEQRRLNGHADWSDDGHYYWLAWPARVQGYFAAQYDGFHEVFGLGPVCATWCNSFDGEQRAWPWESM